MSEDAKRHIVVIGGGIVGVCVAEALVRDGLRVTMLEPGAFGGEQQASYGNGTFVSPASIIPMSMPGLWAKVPGYLLDRRGPLTIRWPYLPRLATWLLRFLAAGWTEGRVTRTTQALADLVSGAPQLHADIAARIGVPDMIREDGLLYLYQNRAAFEAEGLALKLRRAHGVKMQEYEGDALANLVPGLAPRYTLGVMLTGGCHCASPGQYVEAIATWCLANGATHERNCALDLRLEDGKLAAVVTKDGEIACDGAVLAAGIGAATLAKRCGDRIPLEAERGYHVELLNCDLDLPVPVMPQDLKVAIVRTLTGLRIAGQVEFASATASPDWRRADLLRDQVASCFPQLEEPARNGPVKRWQGNRPSTPDGLPVIGPARCGTGVWYAFGHGHVGLNSAPMTARLIADLVAGRPTSLDTTPFAPDRFH
ncbi:FAD-dependent oxidoreductase [Aquicoccus sp. SU-CL01552]|uniref:NAD(P)/FAD-dependent oxidoreductase n=1 Tax=Aquicoccus sp. SU-CL01552 TaxID=3127656 RepID=UPI00310B9017